MNTQIYSFSYLVLVLFCSGIKAMEEQLCRVRITNTLPWAIMINKTKLRPEQHLVALLKNGESFNVYMPNSKGKYVFHVNVGLKIKNGIKEPGCNTGTLLFYEAEHNECAPNAAGVSLCFKKKFYDPNKQS